EPGGLLGGEPEAGGAPDRAGLLARARQPLGAVAPVDALRATPELLGEQPPGRWARVPGLRGHDDHPTERDLAIAAAQADLGHLEVGAAAAVGEAGRGHTHAVGGAGG